MADWSAERGSGIPRDRVLVVFVHGGFWRRASTRRRSPTWPTPAPGSLRGPAVWNIEYPRVGMPGGGWPGTALAVSAACGAAVEEAARPAGRARRPFRGRAPRPVGCP